MLKFIFTAGFLATSCFSPAYAQEREWQLDAVDEDVFLVFGVPSTNDVGVSFWCKINSGAVSIFAPMPADTKPSRKMTVSIGDAEFDLPIEKSDVQDSKTVEAKLAPQDAIISALKSAERFSLILGKHKAIYPLLGADFEGLLKLCTPLP